MRSVTSRTRPSSLCFASIASTASTALGVAARLQRDDADAGLVEAQIEQRVVELAPRADGPRARRPPSASSSGVCGSAPVGRAHGERRRARLRRRASSVDVAALGARAARASPASHGRRLLRATIASSAALHRRVELRFLRGRLVDEVPLDGALAAHALGHGGEHVGQVAPDLALVDEAREPAGAREARRAAAPRASSPRSTRRRRGRSRRTRSRARSRRPTPCPRARRGWGRRVSALISSR